MQMEIRMRNGRLEASWRMAGREAHEEIVRRLRAIRGVEFDRDAKVWAVPLRQADRLLAAFPKASYDYDALCAAFERADERIGIFGQSLLDMSIMLIVVDGRVVAQGDGASPLLQRLIDERNEKLAAWLASDAPVFPSISHESSVAAQQSQKAEIRARRRRNRRAK